MCFKEKSSQTLSIFSIFDSSLYIQYISSWKMVLMTSTQRYLLTLKICFQMKRMFAIWLTKCQYFSETLRVKHFSQKIIIWIIWKQLILHKVNHRRSSHQRCAIKKGALKNFTKFKGKHLQQSLFFSKVQLYLKKALEQVFSCEFCGIFKNTFLQKTSGRLLLNHSLSIIQ